MKFHEFGCKNEKILLMFHGSCMTWDMYEKSIKIMAEKIHVIIPAITGHDLSIKEDFTSVEEVVCETENWLFNKGYDKIDGLYGLSMGGGLAIHMLANNRIKVKYAVIDGGMTPYELPWLVTRFIVVRDFIMLELGRSSKKLVERFFPPDKYTNEVIDGFYKALRHYNGKSIWRVFESCNNYLMPDPLPMLDTKIEYWYGEREEKDRALDIKYVKKIWTNVKFRKIMDSGHGEYCLRFPDKFAADILQGLQQNKSTYRAD
ncbi:alpha/beta fold hydrolase [Clostridium hydrogenum]|uniref:alpha/beta fold hydrolase n=1 Tax=Clostridium hydrogenum TaxID=2855764 RepID=UPI001F20A42B|nr:alpha/beta hydrolase [Clostridium hydrogenum]